MGYDKFDQNDIETALIEAGLSEDARHEVLSALGIRNAKVRKLEVVIESDVEYSRNDTLDEVIRDAVSNLTGVTRVKTRSAGPDVPRYIWTNRDFDTV